MALVVMDEMPTLQHGQAAAFCTFTSDNGDGGFQPMLVGLRPRGVS
jgi:hypothetical protein